VLRVPARTSAQFIANQERQPTAQTAKCALELMPYNCPFPVVEIVFGLEVIPRCKIEFVRLPKRSQAFVTGASLRTETSNNCRVELDTERGKS
jgi:hypothetical protein